MINKNMSEKKEKKPDDTLNASVAAKLVIKDSKTKKVVLKTRG